MKRVYVFYHKHIKVYYGEVPFQKCITSNSTIAMAKIAINSVMRDTGGNARWKDCWIICFVLLRAEGDQEQKHYFTVDSLVAVFYINGC
jgi:hypothetical protein